MRLAALLSLLPTLAFPDCTTDAMLVFDGSTSMVETGAFTGTRPKLDEAREALARSLPLVEDVRKLGLMTYGPSGRRPACEGVTLAFTPRDKAASAVLAEIDALTPAGLTPLTTAVESAAEVMQYRNTPSVIVLLTDGNETCGGRPCATSERLSAKANDLTIHVVAYRLNAHDEYFRWDNPEQEFGTDNVARCFADATGGLYLTTETIDELTEALLRTLGCPIIGRLDPKHVDVW